MAVHYLLDTDITSYLIKQRHPEVTARFSTLDPEEVAISTVTKAEILFGLQRLPSEHPLPGNARTFLSSIQVLSWGEEPADAYASIRWRLQTQGIPIGELDTMIAAHPMSIGATLVTNNTKHFGRLAPDLTIENWATD